MRRFVRIGLLLSAFVALASCQNKTEDCIDEIAKKANTEEGVRRGIENCYLKNSEQKGSSENKDQSKIIDDCNITWDGEAFVNGVPAQKNNYFIVGFPNSTSLAYLPKNMSKEVGEKLIRNNWELIKVICPAIKASEIN